MCLILNYYWIGLVNPVKCGTWAKTLPPLAYRYKNIIINTVDCICWSTCYGRVSCFWNNLLEQGFLFVEAPVRAGFPICGSTWYSRVSYLWKHLLEQGFLSMEVPVPVAGRWSVENLYIFFTSWCKMKLQSKKINWTMLPGLLFFHAFRCTFSVTMRINVKNVTMISL